MSSSTAAPTAAASTIEDRIENEYADETFAESLDATTADGEEYLSDYEPEGEFVEEEVESLPEHERLNPGGLTIIGHSALLHSTPANKSDSNGSASQISVASTPSSIATTAVPASQPKKSSLPSLSGGLPSIGAMSSSLTAAGRAHFAQSSLFSKSAAPIPSADIAAKPVDSLKSKPASSPPNASAAAPTSTSSKTVTNSSSSTSDNHISASYATANEIWSVENLGLHAVSVTDADSSDASARNTVVTLIDEGRLSLWAGKVGSDSMALPSVNGSAAATGAFGNSLFLRAATSTTPTQAKNTVVPDISKLSDKEYLHIWIDEADGTLNPSAEIVDDEGRAVAELPSSFQPKRLGCYRFRLISRSTSLPAQPDNLQQFMSKAQQMGLNTQNAHATESSPFEIAPIITLYVAVEKFLPLESSSSKSLQDVNERCNKSLVLPPLPLNTLHTFWISTNQPSKTCSLYFAGNAASAEGENSANTDSFELNLDISPLHESILRELDLKSVQMDGDDGDDDDEDDEGNGKPISDRKRKKNAKKKAKKKKDKQQQKATNVDTDSTLSTSTQPALVEVHITPTSDSSSSELLQLSFQPSSAPCAAPTPSLVDLLATLAASPSTSLPDSILQANQSMSQLGALTYQLMNQNGASSADGTPQTSATSSSASTNAAASTTPASSTAVHLSALDRKQHWPFSVSLSAMRLSESSEGHKSFDHLDLLHNVPLPSRIKSSSASAANGDWKQRRVVYVGDHAVTILRTVGLLCAWESPKDGSQLNEPVLVSQQPFLSYHVQLSIRRLDPEEADEREFEAMLG